jgi:hypothetical protein
LCYNSSKTNIQNLNYNQTLAKVQVALIFKVSTLNFASFKNKIKRVLSHPTKEINSNLYTLRVKKQDKRYFQWRSHLKPWLGYSPVKVFFFSFFLLIF